MSDNEYISPDVSDERESELHPIRAKFSESLGFLFTLDFVESESRKMRDDEIEDTMTRLIHFIAWERLRTEKPLIGEGLARETLVRIHELSGIWVMRLNQLFSRELRKHSNELRLAYRQHCLPNIIEKMNLK